MLKGKVVINQQEEPGDYQFIGIPQVMTSNFKRTFGAEAIAIAFTALALVLEHHPKDADYLQTFNYIESGKEQKFWLINDVDHITFLLPEDY